MLPDNDNPTSPESPSDTGRLIGGIVAAVVIIIIFAITVFVILMLIYCNRCRDLKKATGID